MFQIKKLAERIDNIDSEIKNLKDEIAKTNQSNDNLQNKFSFLEEKLTDISNEIRKVNDDASYRNYFNSFYFKFQNLELIPYNNKINNKKKVLLCGFYGAPNLGDELMLETILSYLPDNIDLTVMLSENQDYDITSFPKCSFIHYPKNMMDINQIASYFDTIIFGGGALIDDYKYEGQLYQMPLGYVLINLSKRAIILEKQVILLGLSCSKSISDKNYIDKLKYVIDNCTYASFRNQKSIDTLSEYFNTDKIILSDDIIFANKNLLKQSTNKNSEINIGLIMICTEENNKLIDTIINILDTKLKGKKYRINLIPFYNYVENDKKFYDAVTRRNNNVKIQTYEYANDSATVINEIDNQDYIISMRYHGCLLSLLRGKKTYSIILDTHRHYINKMNYIYDNYGFERISDNLSKISKNKIEKSISLLLSSKNCNNFDFKKIHSKEAKELENIFKKYL